MKASGEVAKFVFISLLAVKRKTHDTNTRQMLVEKTSVLADTKRDCINCVSVYTNTRTRRQRGKRFNAINLNLQGQATP